MAEDRREGKYRYDWVTLLNSRNWHNIVKQLNFNFKKEKEGLERHPKCTMN